jgi:hypothetical protein
MSSDGAHRAWKECGLESPEVHPPHARHGVLPRWLEGVIALTALITSISSIAIAVHHGHIMEKLVQANSIPYMQGGFSDILPDGTYVLSLDLLNRGVGPAHEQSLRVKADGRYVSSLHDLIVASLGPEQAAEAGKVLEPMQNRVKTRFIPGGQEQLVFRIRKTPENAQYLDQLKTAQKRWEIEYCFCSVFQDCWQVLGKWQEPVPVGKCVRDESKEFLP